MRTDVAVTISLDVSSGKDFERATEKVRAFGVRLNRVLPRIHVLTGNIDPTRIEALRSMPEVSAVECEGFFQLDPAG